jgi:hypothetical protein
MGPPPRSGWSSYNFPMHSVNISHRLTFEKPDLGIRSFMNNASSSNTRPSSLFEPLLTSALRPPHVVADRLPHSRTQSSNGDLVSTQFGQLQSPFNPHPSPYRSPQRFEPQPQLSLPNTTSAHESLRYVTSPDQYYNGRLAEHSNMPKVGYISPLNNGASYGNLGAEQYTGSQSTTSGTDMYSAPVNEMHVRGVSIDRNSGDYRPHGVHYTDSLQSNPRPNIPQYPVNNYPIQAPQAPSNHTHPSSNGQAAHDGLASYQYSSGQSSPHDQPSYHHDAHYGYRRL